MKRSLASFCCAFLLPAFALCQGSSFSMAGGANSYGTMSFGAPFSNGATITGAPFSAEEVNESVQTLPDGTHIRQTLPGSKTYRDAMGRTRTERQPFRGMFGNHADKPEGPTIVEINDPVAHAKYLFVLGDSVVHHQQLPTDPAAQTAPIQAEGDRQLPAKVEVTSQPAVGALEPANNALKTISSDKKCPVIGPEQQAVPDESFPKTTVENLGTQIVEGIPAEGMRNTTTFPVDWMGNDRPITTISETWTSPDIKEIILTQSNDPRSGENTHKLINISRSEPDPGLFEPPPGTMKNEDGAFTLNWNSPR